MNSSKQRFGIKPLLALAAGGALVLSSTPQAQAADRSWSGATASYTNAANWTGGIVPGVADNAINDNGTNNVVQINVGNPDWTVGQIRAGNSVGNGAFVQNGQTVTPLGTNYNGTVISEFFTPFRLGVVAADTGVYTLNGGTLNFGGGQLHVGEVGTGIFNLNGGSIIGSNVLSVNFGGIAVPNPAVINATAGHGPYLGDYTYFEQGYNPAFPSRGLPPAGTTIVSVTQADHSYTMAPSYTANNAVILDTAVSNATITLSTPTALTGLSFVGSAGNGPVVCAYTINHSSGTPETGTISVPDWFGTGQEVLNVEGRCNGLGLDIQNPGPAGGNPVGNAPYLLSVDISLTNPNTVTSINLSYVSGGGTFATATLLAVSGQTTGGGAFAPLAITGYNADVVIEAAAPSPVVSSSIIDIFNQTNGSVNLGGGGQLFVGNGGNGVYNMSGGSINVDSWLITGRSGGNGEFNMSGGTINKTSGNAFVVSSRDGGPSVGTFNHSGGTINSGSEIWIGQAANTAGGAIGTNNISGTAIVNVTNWLAVGREGALGVLNISGGTINKFGGGNITITHGTGASGTVNQTGGSFNVFSGEVWIGEDSGTGTWNMNGGSNSFGSVHIAQTGSATGNLNVNGGTLTASELTTGNALGVSTLNLNGGVIRPAGNSLNFLHDVFIVALQSGGAIFDSQGFNLTIPQALPSNGGDASGGLTKNGLGTLTLSGLNTYTGPTVVNGGTLAITTDPTGGGNYTVASGAELSLKVQSLNAQLNAANVTFASPSPILSVDLGSFGNPSSAPLNVGSTLAVNGAVTVNITDGLPQPGQFPLIKYVTLTGAGSFVAGSLPVGVGAYISNNVGNLSVDLVITNVNVPRWEGLAGGDWDINLTTNWINIGNGSPTKYVDGNVVLFDDSALGTTNVNLTTTVSPGGVTVNNTNLIYTLAGTGRISGSKGVTKQGAGTLNVVNTGGNNYTGPTVISGGTLSVTNLANGGVASAIGASSANQTNLVFAGGKLSYAGPSVSINRGYTVTADQSSIETVGNLTLSGVAKGPAATTFSKTGPGQLAYTAVTFSNVLSDPTVAAGTYLIKAGTVLLDGSAGIQTNYSRNLNLGFDAGTNATIILTNTALSTRLTLGNGVNCTGTMILNSNSFLKVLGGGGNFVVGGQSTGSPTDGVLTQNAGTSIDADAELWVGQGGLGTGTYNMNGGTALFRNWVAIGRNGGNATFNMTGGLVVRNTDNTGNHFMIGSRDGTTGTRGTLNQSGGTIVCFREYWIGEAQNNAAAAVGTNNISGTASLIVSNWIAIGREGAIGVLNLSGGSVAKLNTGNHIEIGNGTGSTGTINQTGGTFTNLTSETRLGTGAPGIWNMSGGSANLAALILCLNSGCTNGTLNLNGGVMTATEVRANQTAVANVSTLNFNGGTLAAGSGANTNFLRSLTAANVLSGGAIISSGTSSVSVPQVLRDGGGGGGLTKTGSGALFLNGVNTYTGLTVVSNGTLGGSGTITGSVVAVASTTLAPGGSGAIGTLSVGGDVNFSGNLAIEVNKSVAPSNDVTSVVGGLTNLGTGVISVTNLGPALVAGDKFTLFNKPVVGGGTLTFASPPGVGLTWANNLAVDGSIVVTGGVNTTPTNIVSSFTSSNVTLSWPADHTGWSLQVQTNTRAVGLATNWFVVPGSSATNSVTIPTSQANPTVFYRLAYP